MDDEYTRSQIRDWLRREGNQGLDLSPGNPICLAALKLIEELEKTEVVANAVELAFALKYIPHSEELQYLTDAVCKRNTEE